MLESITLEIYCKLNSIDNISKFIDIFNLNHGQKERIKTNSNQSTITTILNESDNNYLEIGRITNLIQPDLTIQECYITYVNNYVVFSPRRRLDWRIVRNLLINKVPINLKNQSTILNDNLRNTRYCMVSDIDMILYDNNDNNVAITSIQNQLSYNNTSGLWGKISPITLQNLKEHLSDYIIQKCNQDFTYTKKIVVKVSNTFEDLHKDLLKKTDCYFKEDNGLTSNYVYKCKPGTIIPDDFFKHDYISIIKIDGPGTYKVKIN